jgi:hypothetical protein
VALEPRRPGPGAARAGYFGEPPADGGLTSSHASGPCSRSWSRYRP